jgi:capsular polysaccharide biosynthesis protein
MNRMNEISEDIVEIDLMELFQYIKKRILKIIIFTLVIMVISAVFTIFFINKKYQSTARIFPKPQTESGLVSDYSSINTNTAMVNNYVELMKGTNILSEVAERLDLDRDYISNSLSVSSQTNTMIISVTSTTTDPELSKKIVDTTLDVFYDEVEEKLDIKNIMTVDTAEVATSASSPNLFKNIGLGAVIGFVISFAYYFVMFMLDTRIHTKEEAEKYFDLPVLGVVPNIED